MTQPHHHAFNALESLFHRRVSFHPLLPFLLEKGVISRKEESWFPRDDRSAMKVLTGYLRSKDYDTFLGFLESVFEAGEYGGKVDYKLMESVKTVVDDFDRRNNTTHSDRIKKILDRYTSKTRQQQEDEGSVVETKPEETLEKQLTNLSLNDLPFLEKLEEFTFQEDGGVHWNSKFDIKIEAPPGICGEDSVKFTLGICPSGPFAIADEYEVATDFIYVETSSKLNKPVRIYLQHCLKMVKYEKTESVVVLKANLQQITKKEKYVFEPYWGYEIGGNQQEEKRQIVRPEISSESPHLWFEIDEFCILCAAYKKEQKSVAEQHTESQSTAPQGPIPSHSIEEETTPSHKRIAVMSPGQKQSEMGRVPSLEEDSTKERSGSFASPTPATSSIAMETVPSAEIESELTHSLPQRRLPLKRKRSASSITSTLGAPEEQKQHCCIEYLAIFMRPKKISATNTFWLFVCQNCLTSIRECFRQAENYNFNEEEYEHQFLSGTFIHNEIEVSYTSATSCWKILPRKTPIIKEADIHLQQKSYASYEVENLCSLGVYPPRIAFEVYLETENVSYLTECKFNIEGFNCSDTIGNAFFSVLMPVVGVLQINNSVTSDQYMTPEQVLNHYNDDLEYELADNNSDTAVRVTIFLYSKRVLSERERKEVLNRNGYDRAGFLLKHIKERVKDQPQLIEHFFFVLEEKTELTGLLNEMKRTCGFS